MDDANQTETQVDADYAFDCTGQKRHLIRQLNEYVGTEPFKTINLCDVIIKNHLFAYVQMEKTEAEKFLTLISIVEKYPDRPFPPENKREHYINSLVKLHDLGWKEFRFPRIYGEYFGKNKVSLYLHAPEGSKPANAERWLQAVMESYCFMHPISYRHLKPSNKYPNLKTRFNTFTTSAHALNRLSYPQEQQGLPCVIALGDAQIDSDYSRANGILHGMRRTDALMTCMTVSKARIDACNLDQYHQLLQPNLREHSFDLIRANQQISYFFQQSAIDATRKLTSVNMHTLGTQPTPSQFLTLLNQLGLYWKEQGNQEFNNKNLNEAIKAYTMALYVFTSPTLQLQSQSMQLNLHSNLSITYNAMAKHASAYTHAQQGLSLWDTMLDPFGKFKTKLMHHLAIAANGMNLDKATFSDQPGLNS